MLELVQIAETAISDSEVKALHQVIAELSDHIRRTALGSEALIRPKQIVGVKTREMIIVLLLSVIGSHPHKCGSRFSLHICNCSRLEKPKPLFMEGIFIEA